VEPQTALGKWEARGEVAAAPEEQYEAQFLLASERLTAAGYEHYEVSNFARPGRRAVHNSAYWSGAPYLGLGPSAHGYDGITRRWNTPAYAAWQQTVAHGRDPVAGQETLSPGNRVTEGVYLGLRTRDGLTVADEELPLIKPWIEAGWMEFMGQSQRIRCTPLGWLRLDSMASALTALRSR
jgi:oxygen-independent coproporphyrinogen-3 oxidase